MNGYGSHTYSLLERRRRAVLGQVPLHDRCRDRVLHQRRGPGVVGQDREIHQGDLFGAIERGELPKWRVCVQVMPERRREVSPQPVRPDQGLAARRLSPDRRRHAGAEPQRRQLLRRDRAGGVRARQHRAGHRPLARQDAAGTDLLLRRRAPLPVGTHYEALPVNQPKCPVHHYHGDGAMRFDDNPATPTPITSPTAWAARCRTRVVEPPLRIAGDADRYDHREGNDDYTQPGNLFRLMPPDAQARLMDNIRGDAGRAGRDRPPPGGALLPCRPGLRHRRRPAPGPRRHGGPDPRPLPSRPQAPRTVVPSGFAPGTTGRGGLNAAKRPKPQSLPRRRGEQRPRVLVAGLGEDLARRALSTTRPSPHHGDAVADLRRDAQIVGDEQHREAQPAADVGEQLQHLRLHRDVERRDRLVGDQQLGLHRQRAGDADALALAARELVRVAVRAPRGRARPAPSARAPARSRLGARRPWFIGPRRSRRRPSGAGRARGRGPGRRSARAGAAARSGAAREPPSRRRSRQISPRVGSISRAMQRATVDLPEPDSPTMPSVSPRRISSMTPLDRRAPRGRGRASRRAIVLASPAAQRRRPAAAASRARGVQARHRGDQHPRVVVRRRASAPRAAVPASTSRPCCITATRSAISATTPKSWVMNRMPVPCRPAGRVISAQDLRLGRDVERGRRLVGDQERGLERQRRRDHHALALPARELVRVGVDASAPDRAGGPREAARGPARAAPPASSRVRRSTRRSARRSA